MKPAERSSWCTWSRTRPSAARASAIGVEREPGAITASVSPPRTHSSTSVAQNVAAVVSAGSEPVTHDSLGLVGHAHVPRPRGARSGGTAGGPTVRGHRHRSRPAGGRARLHPDLGLLVADRRRPWPRSRPGPGRRTRPRRLGPRRARPVGRGRRRWPRPAVPAPTWATRWADASACTPRWPDPATVAAAGADQRHRRASTTPPSGPNAGRPTRRWPDHAGGGRGGGLRRRVAGPAAVRRPARGDRPSAGPAGQHRRRPGLQPAPGRHRHPGAPVGPAGRSCPCRCWWWPAQRDPKFVALAERLVGGHRIRRRSWRWSPEAGHTVHLEQPESFLAVLAPLARPHRLIPTVRGGNGHREPLVIAAPWWVCEPSGQWRGAADRKRPTDSRTP